MQIKCTAKQVNEVNTNQIKLRFVYLNNQRTIYFRYKENEIGKSFKICPYTNILQKDCMENDSVLF